MNEAPARQVPRLHVDTGASSPSNDPTFNTLNSPLDLDASPSQSRKPRLSSFTSPEPPPPQSPLLQALQATTNPKAVEFVKILSLLLNNLQNRRRPPSAFDVFSNTNEQRTTSGVGAVLQTLKGAMRFGKKEGLIEVARTMSRTQDVDDTEDEKENDGVFSTEVTVEHLMQLRDVLILSERLGWNILSSHSNASRSNSLNEPSSPRSPFRRKRQSLSQFTPGELDEDRSESHLDKCIAMLAEIVSEDCRYRVGNVKLSRPPNSLQSVCIDLAQCLLSNQRHNPKILADVAFAMIPAFSTFPRELHARLLAFFEEGILRGMLEKLSTSRMGKQLSLGPPLALDQNLQPAESPSAHFNVLSPQDTPPIVSINVEQHVDDTLGMPEGVLPLWTPATASTSSSADILSNSAPSQSLQIYQLSSVVPPLLCSVLENIDWTLPATPLHVVHRLHRLLNLITSAKPDSYLDLLEIVAYHTAPVRLAALQILGSYWPEALGHTFVGKALPFLSYEVDIAIRSAKNSREFISAISYDHQFVAWSFPPPSSHHDNPFSAHSSSSALQDPCHVCSEPVVGFGLRCTHCTCTVHFQCYDSPDGSFLTMYPSPRDRNIQKVAVTRFSRILPKNRSQPPQTVENARHVFRSVNLFTLTPCMACREPLWGIEAQALECSGCRQFLHPRCAGLSTLPPCRTFTLSSSGLTVEWEIFRRSFRTHFAGILFSETELLNRTYEEVSICYGVLWLQLQILRNGVAGGSFIVEQNRPKGAADEFEIQYVVKLYAKYLAGDQLPKSAILEEWMAQRLDASPPQSILFDWSLMVYITALIKSPRSSDTNAAGMNNQTSFLSVNSLGGGMELSGVPVEMEDDADTAHPFELVVLSHMRDALGFELNIFLDPAAHFLLSHLHSLGWFRRLDSNPNLFNSPTSSYCVFPLPLIIDFSTSVETLVCAIDVCLQDLDVSLNEVGFLWLMKRCWPNGMTSDYALQRLAGLVISWIVSEDDRLVRIAQDFVAQGVPLPGVRPPYEAPPWPELLSARSGASTATRSGGDYVDCRRLLLDRYASRWLQALHDQDPDLYAKSISERLMDLSEDEDIPEMALRLLGNGLGTSEEEQKVAEQASKVTSSDRWLRNLLKICQAQVIFSAFDPLFIYWFDSVLNLGVDVQDLAFSSLPRWFARSADISRRSVVPDPSNAPEAVAGNVDPWRVLLDVASEGASGLNRATLWLLILAQSTVDIPIHIFRQLNSYAKEFEAPLGVYSTLVEAIFCACWIQPFGKQPLIEMIAGIHEDLQESVLNKTVDPLILGLLQYSLAAILVLCGVERSLIISYKLVDERRLKAFGASARSRTTRMISGQFGAKIDAQFMMLVSRYIDHGSQEVSCASAKFLGILYTCPSLFSAEDADQFLTMKGDHLYQSVWRFYDTQDPGLFRLRTPFMLRIISVDSQPFYRICATSFDLEKTDWNTRFNAISRLFAMILDLNNPELDLKGRRAALLPIFFYFFRSIWVDPREEVRLAARTLSLTLLPAHLATISMCWDEAFINGSTEERLELLAFLHQLIRHFLTWRVLSWGTIAGAMLDEDIEDAREENRKSMMVENAKQITEPIPEDDNNRLHVALVSLSLQLLGNGITADVYVLLKIKHHLARLLGFTQADLIPNADGSLFVRFNRFAAMPSSSYSLLNGLLRALDATIHSLLPPSVMGTTGDTDTPTPCYIGAIFIDIVLSAIPSIDFQNIPYLVARPLLDALTVIIYKYDITRRSLRHLQDSLTTAVDAVTRIVRMDLSYDIKSGAFTVAQAFLRTWPLIVIKILGHQIFTVSDLLFELKLANDNLLVGQGAAFLEAAFVQFSRNGLFILLLKYPIVPGFFEVVAHVMRAHAKSNPSQPGQALKDILLSDTFTKLMDRVDQNLSRILTNLKSFIETVHHQGYSPALMQDATAACTSLSRVAGDPSTAPLSSNDWLETCMVIIQHNKALSRDLLVATDSFLRASLLRHDISITESMLDRIFQITITLYRKGEATVGKDSGSQNLLASTILFVLSDSLKNKTRASMSTVDAMLRSVLRALKAGMGITPSPADTLQRLATECAHYMIHGTQLGEMYTDSHLSVILAAADMVHEAAKHNSSFLYQHFSNHRSQKAPPLRAWDALALAACVDPTTLPSINLLVNLLSFSLSYSQAMQPLLAPSQSSNPQDNAALVVNHSSIAIKLWLMLCRKKRLDPTLDEVLGYDMIRRVGAEGEAAAEAERSEREVWNEVWPQFESAVMLSITSVGEGATPFTTAIWTSFADLVIFVHQIRSPVALDSSVSHASTLKRLLKLSRNEAANTKFNRALHCITDPPPDVPFDILLNQTKSEFLASEKLIHALEKRKAPTGHGGGRTGERRWDYRTIG